MTFGIAVLVSGLLIGDVHVGNILVIEFPSNYCSTLSISRNVEEQRVTGERRCMAISTHPIEEAES